MSWPHADEIHRTAKQLVDNGRAATPAEAVAMLERFVLQVDVGPDVLERPAAQAALLTAVNAGQRAFLGGVLVRLDDDPLLSEGWGAGRRASDAVRQFGGHVSDEIASNRPTMVIGNPSRHSLGEIVMYATFGGWVGAVVQDIDNRLSDDGVALAGVIAGALAVSDAFQHCVGDPEAGRRDIGLSLWRPDSHWESDQARGPALQYLPASCWLLGLGHLGQGYAWSLGLLPYARPADAKFFLVDPDAIVPGNLATGLLARATDIGALKTRIVAAGLESLGMHTRIQERRFDDSFRLQSDEPRVALVGFDDPKPRRLLDGRFAHVIDTGLGGGPVEYLDMLIRTFPSDVEPSVAFASERPVRRHLAGRYEDQVQRLIAAGADEGDARCGIAELAGISVGAAFVGAIAGALGVADILRYLHSGSALSVISLDLRSPNDIRTASNESPGPFENLGYCPARVG
jgi:hypothetical protein